MSAVLFCFYSPFAAAIRAHHLNSSSLPVALESYFLLGFPSIQLDQSVQWATLQSSTSTAVLRPGSHRSCGFQPLGWVLFGFSRFTCQPVGHSLPALFIVATSNGPTMKTYVALTSLLGHNGHHCLNSC